ncbi:MAG: RNA polymerase sigma factor [Kineosporiaceae bacterium]
MGTPDGPGPAPESRRDADLAVAAASGDSDALAAIYDRYASRVFALAARQLRDRDAAADVTQDVFLTAAQRIGGLADPERLRPWIFAVARHRIVDHVRRSRRVVPTDTIEDVDSMELSSAGSEGFDRVRGDELRVLLADSSAGLDDRDRLVLELAYGAELAGSDLADALGVAENTAHQLLSRARQRMRTSLGALLVARQGRRDCEDLQALLAPWDGTFSTLWRKRVARHVDGCDVCSDTERRVLAPAALGSAFPVLLVPDGLRDGVLTGLDLVSAPAAAPARDSWHDDGFPPGEGGELVELAGPAADPGPRRPGRVVLAVAGVVLLGVLGAWWGATALGGQVVEDEVVAAPAPAPPQVGPDPSTAPASATASRAASPEASAAPPSSTTGSASGPADPAPPDSSVPAPVLLADPAGPVRMSRSGVAAFTVSHTGDAPATVTVSAPEGFAADPVLLDLGPGAAAGVTVRWAGSPSNPPPPATVSLAAPGFQGTTVEILPFRDPALPRTTTASTTATGTLVLPPPEPPVLLPPGPG